LRWTGRHGAKQDKPQAQSLFEKGCDAKDSESCYYLSTTFLGEDKNAEVRNDDKEKAFEYSLKACNLNHIYACANLCQLYKHGMGCEKNEELADAAKRKALALRDLYNKKDGGVVFGEN
jgi:cytochrome c oxidase assembly factor 7